MSGQDRLPDGHSLAALARHVQAGVAVIDRAGLFIAANDQYTNLHGVDADDLPGRHFTDLTPPRLRAPMQRLHDALFVTGFEGPSYWQLRRRGGEEIYLRSQSVLYHCAEGTPYRVATVVDMTEHQRLERDLERERAFAEAAIGRLRAVQRDQVQAEKMASLEDLLCGVAHELNTPIGVTLTATTHLEHKVADLRASLAAGALTWVDLNRFLETTTQTLDLLRGSTMRAGAVVENFRQVSAGGGQEDQVTLRLCAHVKAAVHALASALPPDLGQLLMSDAVEIVVKVPDDLTLTTCPAALGRVVTALLVNALEHGVSARGRGRLLVWAGQAGDAVTLTVRDNGVGIPPAEQDRVFDPFYRGANCGARHKGLGLYMVHNLVTGLLGGTIAVESVVGHHTAFRITLPNPLCVH